MVHEHWFRFNPVVVPCKGRSSYYEPDTGFRSLRVGAYQASLTHIIGFVAKLCCDEDSRVEGHFLGSHSIFEDEKSKLSRQTIAYCC